MNRAGSYLAATAGDILEAVDNLKEMNERQAPPQLPSAPPVSKVSSGLFMVSLVARLHNLLSAKACFTIHDIVISWY